MRSKALVTTRSFTRVMLTVVVHEWGYETVAKLSKTGVEVGDRGRPVFAPCLRCEVACDVHMFREIPMPLPYGSGMPLRDKNAASEGDGWAFGSRRPRSHCPDNACMRRDDVPSGRMLLVSANSPLVS